MALSPYIVTKGVVLRETETRDADKILTLLTAERGKLSVIARGVCRKGCKFAACAQPLAYSEWTLYKKGDWYYANEGATLELFNGLRADLDAMALGFYLAELTEAVTTEDAPHQGLLSHLLNGLYAVSVLRKPLPLVKAAFEGCASISIDYGICYIGISGIIFAQNVSCTVGNNKLVSGTNNVTGR